MSYGCHHHHHHRHHHHGGDSGIGCIVMLVLGFIALPVVGLVMMCSGDEDQKALGLVILIVGIILWIMVGANM